MINKRVIRKTASNNAGGFLLAQIGQRSVRLEKVL